MPQKSETGNNLGRFAFFTRSAQRWRGTRAPSRQVEPLEDRVLLSSTWFVSPSGNDSSTGTLANPFRTIQRAASQASTGDTVDIRGGTYRETVRPAYSGVTFENYNGETVTVSGADVVSGFSLDQGAVYRTGMNWDLGDGNNQVFVDGRMINEARWPNTSLDLSHPTLSHVNSVSGSTLYDGALAQPAGYWTGAQIHITPGQAWVGYTGTVTDSGPGWITVSLPSLGTYEMPTAGNAYYLYGKFQGLDGAGEWYRDASGQLYAWTPGGDDPANHLVEAKHRQFAFDLSGRTDTTLRGIHLFAATVNTDSGSLNTTIDGIEAKYIAHFTKQASGWSPSDTTGISLKGANSVVENSTIAFSAGDGIYLGASGTQAINNIIHDVDYGAGDAAGVRIGASDTLVQGNTIYNTGRCGVTQRGVSNVRVLSNTIRDVMLQTTDGGGIYTFRTDGAGSEYANNTIYNAITGGFGGVGIFLDDNSSNFIVHDNTIWNVNAAMKLNSNSRGHQIYNNELGATSRSIDKSASAGDWNGTTIHNNSFYKPVSIGTGASVASNVTLSGVPEKALESSGGAAVVGRYVFYNNSKFDGNNASVGTSDDAAIATDKQALLPGRAASFANYTSYSKGINGIMIDVSGLVASQLSAADFDFKIGNSDATTAWTSAPAPSAISVRPGAGANGSDRITLRWADGAIQKQWLSVSLKADANTGLATSDIFYFGNAIGDTGDSTANAVVNASDEIATRNNPRTLLDPAAITNPFDHNRDGKVDATDQLLARSNVTNFLSALKLIVTAA